MVVSSCRGFCSYNEFVLSGRVWHSALPDSIEAFFFPATERCEVAPNCKQRSIDDHRRFLERFPNATAALLRLNQSEWERPFRVAV